VSNGDILREYGAKEDSHYAFRIESRDHFLGSEVLQVGLQSQKWKGIIWKHRLKLLVPETMNEDSHALLFITGSGTGVEELTFCKLIADSLKLPCAILHDVPNQPLFNDLYEDEIIAYTFSKFMETRDGEWPLLVPMVKAAKKALDVIEELFEQSFQKPRGFIVTGASKRGWTTWLLSAIDKRVKGIAPLVFDNLNFAAQMRHQLECYGAYSEQISDYTRLRLQEKLQTEIGQSLVDIVDPYSYRDSIPVPKLIVNGTNDRYWTIDSLNLYYSGLRGRNHVLYVPNSGHSLEDKRRMINTMLAFIFSVNEETALPELKSAPRGDSVLEVVADNPLYVDVWKASSDTKDFRDSRWESQPGIKENGSYIFQIDSRKGFTAVFGEATFQLEGPVFSLSTTMNILKPKQTS